MFSNGPAAMGSQTMTGRAAAAGDMSWRRWRSAAARPAAYASSRAADITGNGGVTGGGDARHATASAASNFVGGAASARRRRGIRLRRASSTTSRRSATRGGAARRRPARPYTEQPWALQRAGRDRADGQRVQHRRRRAGAGAAVPDRGAGRLDARRQRAQGAVRAAERLDGRDGSQRDQRVREAAVEPRGSADRRSRSPAASTGRGRCWPRRPTSSRPATTRSWTGQVIAKSASISGLHLIQHAVHGLRAPPDVEPSRVPTSRWPRSAWTRGARPRT